MKKTVLLILIFLSTYSFSQKYTISGYVEDSETGERFIGASVYDANVISHGTLTNTYGFYSLTIPTGKIKFTSSFVGCTPYILEFNLSKDTVINIKLSASILLNEVVVKGTENKVDEVQVDTNNISVSTIKKLPVLLGEVDVLKTIQLLPGVKSGGEGSSGIYVRGGGPDQNLILLDGVPVYNVNHLFGFFSVFNADAIADVNLIKGGFPARYGGRLSCVLDIRMKEGNMKKINAEANIGIIASKFLVEGPIIKDKCSFLITGRRTYIDALAAPIITAVNAFNGNENFRIGYYFYDLNGKINYKFSDKDRLYLSFYGGKDKFYLKTKYGESDFVENESNFGLDWGNITNALRWNHLYSNKLFSNLTLTYSRYNFTTEVSDKTTYFSDSLNFSEELNLKYFSGIDDIGLKYDFDYTINTNQKIRFGANSTFHIFSPGVTSAKYIMGDSSLNLLNNNDFDKIYATEYSVYVEDEFSLGQKIKINTGIHGSAFDVRDTLFYSIQPRFSARFLLTEWWSVKIAYSQMKQYLHFLTTSTIGLPTDLWLPATNRIFPEKSIQYAAGTVFSITDQVDFSIEGYYKDLTNLIEYKEGESFFGSIFETGSASSGWEDKVEMGKGWAYGGEFLLQKSSGDLTGWIGYTLSWAYRQFPTISNGEIFPYKYDKRHDISIVATYTFNDNVNIGATWVYSTGIWTTLSRESFLSASDVDDFIYNLQNGYDNYYSTEYYGRRNNYQYPEYHRLDIGINFTKEKKLWTRTWSFGLYNAYSRHNTFMLQWEYIWDDNFEVSEKKLMSYSLFPVIPSISYNIKMK